MKKVVIACDSFKESISAIDAAKAIERGLKAGAKEEIETVLIPMADGGEGTLEILNSVIAGEILTKEILNHYNIPIDCPYLVKGKMAVVESAKAVGLDLVDRSMRNPAKATSYGLGQLLKHICESGIEKVIIGLGGSGTNDGGLGMLVGLGARLFDGAGEEVPLAIENILKIRHIDFSAALETVRNVEIVVANDVEKPVYRDQWGNLCIRTAKRSHQGAVGLSGNMPDPLEQHNRTGTRNRFGKNQVNGSGWRLGWCILSAAGQDGKRNRTYFESD